MTKDDIIRMARAAGFEDWSVYGRIESKEECLERFATLVAAAEREKVRLEVLEEASAWGAIVVGAIAAEREACAKVCENMPIGTAYENRESFAAAIRARGNT